MNKFEQILTRGSKGILEDRAKNLSAQANLEQKGLVSEKERLVLQLEQKLNTLVDIAPNSTTSLQPGGSGKNFDAQKWVSDLHSIQIQILEAKIELEVAQKTYDTWFGVEVTEKKK